MDRTKLTTIAHGDHLIFNPLSPERLDRVLALLDLEPGDRVLDAGCGRAELLIRLVERYGVDAVGVDINGEFLRAARERAVGRVGNVSLLEREAPDSPGGRGSGGRGKGEGGRPAVSGGGQAGPGSGGGEGRKARGGAAKSSGEEEDRGTAARAARRRDGEVTAPAGRRLAASGTVRREGAHGDADARGGEIQGERGSLLLCELPYSAYRFEPGTFSAGICIGSTHAIGDYRDTLRGLMKAVRPGGHLLVGEGYWRCDPAPEYLAALGTVKSEFQSHAGNITTGAREGLVPLYSCTSSEEEWDHYEGLYLRAVERYAAAHPEDPDSPAMQAHIRRWRDNYLRWGRHTLGFGLYLFMKPR